MRKLTARLLLLFALMGNLGPLALATAVAPAAHACCVRKGAHHCHELGHDSLPSETGELVVREASCCSHDCCGAKISAQWADAQSSGASFSLATIDFKTAASLTSFIATAVAGLRSPRAPPRLPNSSPHLA